MALYVARPLPVSHGEQPQWEVLKDGKHFSGPFHSRDEAEAEARRLSLADIREQASEITGDKEARIMDQGTHVGVVEATNQHYIAFRLGRTKDCSIFDRNAFDETEFALTEGTLHRFILKDGKARPDKRDLANSRESKGRGG